MIYRGLLLDFGGVLTASLYARMGEFCVENGLPRDAIVKALRTAEGRAAIVAAEAGRQSQREFEVVLAGLLGLTSEGLVARLVSLEGLPPRADMIALAARARAAGIRTGVLSNSLGHGGYDFYDRVDLAGLFDAVTISHQVGLRKPERAIYELAAARLGLAPGDCVFVDDTAGNLRTARELGMATVHFTWEDGEDGQAAAQLAEIEALIGLPR